MSYQLERDEYGKLQQEYQNLQYQYNELKSISLQREMQAKQNLEILKNEEINLLKDKINREKLQFEKDIEILKKEKELLQDEIRRLDGQEKEVLKIQLDEMK